MLYKKNDILSHIDDDVKTVVLHGCNCLHVMGAGIAKYLSSKYPVVLEVDRKETTKGSIHKLGTITIAVVNTNLHVVNCYTQFDYRRSIHNAPPVDYTSIRKCLIAVKDKYSDWEIRAPKIGCGLAGGDWNIVEGIFNDILHDCKVTIYEK